MKIIVLGAAAGGGFPQWNAASANNRQAFAGEADCPRMTQCGLAVSANGRQWLLLNASPDLRAQILATRELYPPEIPRSSPIESVVLTGADVDAIAGLLTLREGHAFSVWAGDYVIGAIEANPIFQVLDRRLVRFERIGVGGQFDPVPSLSCRTFWTPGKPPLYLEHVHGIEQMHGSAFGLRITDDRNKVLVFLPSCAEVTPEVVRAIDGAHALFFDGTMYTDDEMIRSGEGQKTARRMGHVAMTGKGGAIEALAKAKIGARYFIHINNSNPVLNRSSRERKAVEEAGWRIAEDGMRIEL